MSYKQAQHMVLKTAVRLGVKSPMDVVAQIGKLKGRVYHLAQMPPGTPSAADVYALSKDIRRIMMILPKRDWYSNPISDLMDANKELVYYIKYMKLAKHPELLQNQLERSARALGRAQDELKRIIGRQRGF